MFANPCLAPAKEHDFAKWEKDIAAFESKDQATAPPKGGIVFVGSSTIVRWKTLAQDFPGLQIINRGFGGNEIEDCTHFADRTIFPTSRKMIFLRAGGNDIHAGKKLRSECLRQITRTSSPPSTPNYRMPKSCISR